MADDDQPVVHAVAEPFYEPIGANADGSGSSSWEDDDDGGREQMKGGRPGMQLALADAGRSIRTVRFWALAGSAVLGSWAASAAAVVMLASLGQGNAGYNAPMLVYALAAALMLSVAAFLAAAAAGVIAVEGTVFGAVGVGWRLRQGIATGPGGGSGARRNCGGWLGRWNR